MNFNRNQRRRRLIRNYPAHNIEESLGIARVIYEQNAGLPLQRTLLATGLGTTVNSSSFVTKLAASEEYGITQGRACSYYLTPCRPSHVRPCYLPQIRRRACDRRGRGFPRVHGRGTGCCVRVWSKCHGAREFLQVRGHRYRRRRSRLDARRRL